ncbi:TPA: DUF63 family protein [archaeon]|nr:DUF63 family protein [Candidatus Naiadarchaeales archaeon SRR2090153.bin461]
MTPEFLSTYFIEPLLTGDANYNIYNTIVYGILFAVAVFGIFKVLRKLEIPIDRNFFIATFPFVILGGLTRALRDAGILKNVFFVAPLIYITLFALAFGSLLGTFYLGKKIKKDYWKLMAGVGFVILAIFVSFYEMINPLGFMQILALGLGCASVIYALGKFYPNLFTDLNKWTMSAAMIDAASTVIAVSYYDYGEKHVLPNFLFGLFGIAWVMLPLKFFVVLAALYVIDRYEQDELFRNFIKFAIVTVTLGPGIRNTLRLAMGV